ncbi:hypothetical protein BS50DRAFT_479335 [Corynespora cassiicola Philippines]|uniref:Pathway-specific nitrogen regulator n=1 Tax=Corynespora cassiicola Philippines TaxID=1448308 RepID=A0A2T2PAK3_CORCC|nr:hypothetical protein BS50DRAFT_479335 [Corynespora cassiicola Philippines]
MTTIHHSPPPGATPFPNYEDRDDQELASPSEVFEGDASFNSDISLPGADEAIPSIEQESDLSEPEPYSSSYTSRPRDSPQYHRRMSSATNNSYVSTLPSEISVLSKPNPIVNGVESTFSPRRSRPSFRNPASIRAMQMSSPPPFESPQERRKGQYKMTTPSRTGRSDTPMSESRQSLPHRTSVQREVQSPRPAPTPAQHLPLVLLHVTILPFQIPYSHEMMAKLMPPWLIENYKLLEEKLQDIVLMRRGLLIPHPRDEYDLLEERILESLELKMPRLLKCGHFVGPNGDAYDYSDEEEEGEADVDSEATGRGSRMSGGTLTVEEESDWGYPTAGADDHGVCTDCHRQVKKPGKGVGFGKKRWDIKIYAANGLMRAGAWSAAWSEMERCDVEISPWIPEDVRKTLEKRLHEEEETRKRKELYAKEVQRRVDEDAAKMKKLEAEAKERIKREEAERQNKFAEEAAALRKQLEEEAAQKKRYEDTLNEKIEEAKEAMRMEFESQSLVESSSVAERFRAMELALKKEQEKAAAATAAVERLEIPLGTLLRNYIVVVILDKRNFFIIVLSALVVFLSMHTDPSWTVQLKYPTFPASLNDIANLGAPAVVTTTATTTATAISTTTITQIQLPEAQETVVPMSATLVESSSISDAKEAESPFFTAPDASPEDVLVPSEPAHTSAPADDLQSGEEITSESVAAETLFEPQAALSDTLTAELELAAAEEAQVEDKLDVVHSQVTEATTCPVLPVQNVFQSHCEVGSEL